MSSKGTKILSLRVRNETVERLEIAADRARMTVPHLVNAVADSFNSGMIDFDGQVVKGVTPNEIDLSGLFEVAKKYKKDPQQVLDTILDRSVGL